MGFCPSRFEFSGTALRGDLCFLGESPFFRRGCFRLLGLLPVSLRFLLTFGESLKPVISISQYLSFTMTVLLACGFVFELPIAVFFLTKLGLLSPRLLRKKWKISFLGIVVVAAVVTPTQDPVNLLLMTLPLLLLYGVSIFVSRLAVTKPKVTP